MVDSPREIIKMKPYFRERSQLLYNIAKFINFKTSLAFSHIFCILTE